MRKFFHFFCLAVLLTGLAAFASAQNLHEPSVQRYCIDKSSIVPSENLNSIFMEDFSGPSFPPSGWTILGDGQTNWISSSNNSAGGVAPEAQFYWNPNFVGVSRFVTPVISTSGYTSAVLSFKHFLDDYGAAGDYTLYVETTSDGGSTWDPVWSLVDPGANAGPESVFLLIENDDIGSDNFQVAFTFDGDSYELDAWNLDDVELMEAVSYDAEATQLNVPDLVAVGDVVTPLGLVTNKGAETISFDVSLEILENGSNSVYYETIAVSDLAAFESENLTFPGWTSTEGNFVVELTTLLSGDENPDNDMLSEDLEALAGVIFTKPLYEEFTSSTCGPCAAANPILDGVLQANPGTHTLIKYQMDWPGSGDPYYTDEGGVRKDYYGVGYVPDLYINADQHYPGDMTQDLYDSYIGLPTAMTIDIVTAEIDESYNITVEANIDVVSDYAAGLTAHIVVVEKVTVGNATTNGETEFYNVMLKMLPDAAGTTLPALTPGNTETLIQTYDMSQTFMEEPNDLEVIVFVQDDADKSIIQSESADVGGDFDAFDVTIIVEDDESNPIEGAEVFLEGNGTLITNASGEVLYDGVFPGTYDYEVVAAGFYDATGTLEVIDQAVTVTVTMETPDFYWFEMFDTEIPSDWTLHYTGWDYLYWYDGKVIFFRQSGTNDPIMMVTPLIDITPADMLYYDMGETSGTPPVAFGTVTDPSDPSTFVELDVNTPGADWETYEYDLNTLNGESEVYLAWKLNTSDFSFFSFDNVIITAGGGGEYCLDGLYISGCDNGDGLVYWDFADVNVPDIACDGEPYTWYHDYTDMVHHVTTGTDYTLTVQGGYGSEHVYVWADFNQDFYMDEDEALVTNFTLTDPGTQYQTTITIPDDAPLGQFTVRFRTNWFTPIPESCFGVNFGNMADFTIEITEGVNDDCEDFDDLTVGGYVAEQLGGYWTTWSNNPGSSEDALVTDAQSSSPDNSFIVDPNVDLVFQFGDEAITTGAWLYSNMMYVAAGTTGYFNVQSDPTPGVAWVIELYFNDGGAGQFIVDGVTTDFTYNQDEWFWVGINIDVDNGLADVWFDEEVVFSFETTNTIGGIDYFGAAATDAAYYDDVCFEEGYIIEPPYLPAPTNLTAEATGVDEDIQLTWDAPGPIGSLLCVDRDGSSDLEFTDDWQFIQPALDALGIEYTYYEVTDLTGDGPDLATMEQYDVIFWFCGEGWEQNQTMSDNDETNLAAYLDGGGNLLLSGHDYLWDRYPSAGSFSPGQFPYDYLGVASVIQDTWSIFSPATANASGISGSFGQGLDFTVTDIYTSDKEGLYIDELNSLDTDLFQVTSPAPVGVAGVQFNGGAFRTAFTTLSIAAITEQSDIEDVLAAGLAWLSNGESDELLGYNIYYQEDGGGFSLLDNTTANEYIHEGAAVPGLHEYYVTAVYDEGESEPSNTASVLISNVDELTAEGLQIFPNPASEMLTVKSESGLRQVRVFNQTGQVVTGEVLNSKVYHLDVSEFKAGIYLLQIESFDGWSSKRIIVK